MSEMRNGHISAKQKQFLIEQMLNEPELYKGMINVQFTAKQAQLKWTEIARKLNEIPGAQKDWKHWRRSWQDIKKNVKKKQGDCKRHSTGTGGGPLCPIVFNKEEELVLGLLSEHSITGDPQIKDQGISFNFDEILLDQNQESNQEENNSEKSNQKVDLITEGSVNTELLKDVKEISRSRKKQKLMETEQSFTDIAKQKLELKKDYYSKKLVLFEKFISTQEEISNSLKEIKCFLVDKK